MRNRYKLSTVNKKKQKTTVFGSINSIVTVRSIVPTNGSGWVKRA